MMSQQDIDRQVMQLHDILYTTERPDNFAKAHELIDINRYRILRKTMQIRKALLRGLDKKPFVFLCNKN